MELSARFLSLISYLYQKKRFVNSSDCANHVGVSEKTIARDFSIYPDALKEFGFYVESKTGAGYKLTIFDDSLFHCFWEKYFKFPRFSQEERLSFLIRKFTTTTEFITNTLLAEELNVSESTIANDIKTIRHELKKYQLTLISIPSKGYKIEGKEMNIRVCLSHHMAIGDVIYQFGYTEDQTRYIRKLVSDCLYAKEYVLSDIHFNQFLYHFYISLLRTNLKEEISFLEYQKIEIYSSDEYRDIRNIFKQISVYFGITIHDNEVLYITVQLLCKENKKQLHLKYDVVPMLTQIVESINNQFNIDLSDFPQIIDILNKNISSLLVRLEYGVFERNDQVETVKMMYPIAFEMAVCIQKVLLNFTGKKLNDDELCFFAIHLSLIEKKLVKFRPLRILLSTTRHLYNLEILQFQLCEEIPEYIKSIDICPAHNLRYYDFSQIDIIIFMSRESFETDIPILHISDFIYQMKMIDIVEFITENARNTLFNI